MATRAQVLAAYAANPKAELFPSEAAIQYWQGAGLGSFDATVDAVRAENPALAAQIDAQRNPPSLLDLVAPAPAAPPAPVREFAPAPANSGATRQQVLAAYAANPRAELNPSEEALQYWQGAGLGSFDATVDAVRAANPALAAQIDVQRGTALDLRGQPGSDVTVNAGNTGTTTTTGNTGTTTTAGNAGETINMTTGVVTPGMGPVAPPTGAATGAATGATRQQVLEAYRNNPLAETNPSEESIQYWMANGLGSFNSTVDAVRAANPDFAKAIDAIRNQQMVTDAYGDIGRTGVGTGANQIDQAGLDYWTNELNSGRISQSEFDRVFSGSVADYLRRNPADDVTQRVAQYRPFANPGIVQTQPVSRGAPAVPGYQSPGLDANLASYLGLPIGAQYNPNVTAGGASPYSQIMAQTPGFINPYADVVSGVPMGGYNPNIYSANLLSNFQRDRAAEAAAETIAAIAARNAADLSGQGGDAASVGNAGEGGAAGQSGGFGGDTGDAPGSDGTPGSGAYMGGLITKVFGPDPAGPDEGQINIQRGEYVIKKSSVKKYGKGLLDMINDGKIPAKKIRSLLD